MIDINKFKKRLLKASESFQKSTGRHFLRTKDIIYCSFETAAISVKSFEAQRNSEMRLKQLELTKDKVKGKTILDLGCHIGAMLFQLSNYQIKSGCGIEYDSDKVDLAVDICKASGLSNIRFISHDLDTFDYESAPSADIVLALSIEKHVKDLNYLFKIIGFITKEMCCFEGNAGCDQKKIINLFQKQGFRYTKFLGYCTDDILPDNNVRPIFVAYKSPPPAKDGGE